MEWFSEFSSSMNGWVESFGYLGLFVGSMIGAATVVLVIPIDGLAVLAAGFLNPVLVGVVAGVGAATGEMSAYFLGRGGRYIYEKKEHSISEIVDDKENKESKAHKMYHKAEAVFEKYGFWSIPIFAVTPLPMDVIGMLCGAIGYPAAKFYLGVLIGRIARGLVLAGVGTMLWKMFV